MKHSILTSSAGIKLPSSAALRGVQKFSWKSVRGELFERFFTEFSPSFLYLMRMCQNVLECVTRVPWFHQFLPRADHWFHRRSMLQRLFRRIRPETWLDVEKGAEVRRDTRVVTMVTMVTRVEVSAMTYGDMQ